MAYFDNDQHTEHSYSPKLIPWFVSDVTPPDFKYTVPSLLSESFFTQAESITPDSARDHVALQTMVNRWQSYLESGAFSLSVPPETPLGGNAQVNEQIQFWTGPWPYWELQVKAPALFEHLKSSQLVIFKVDVRIDLFSTLTNVGMHPG